MRGRGHDLSAACADAPEKRSAAGVAITGFHQRDAVLLAAGGGGVLAGVRSDGESGDDAADYGWDSVDRAAVRVGDGAESVVEARGAGSGAGGGGDGTGAALGAVCGQGGGEPAVCDAGGGGAGAAVRHLL